MTPGRRREDEGGHCLRCGAALSRCACGESWNPCLDCGYPPTTVPRSETLLERRRCHCQALEDASWQERYTNIPPGHPPRRRKEDAIDRAIVDPEEP